jgi:hypothetical protein
MLPLQRGKPLGPRVIRASLTRGTRPQDREPGQVKSATVAMGYGLAGRQVRYGI